MFSEVTVTVHRTVVESLRHLRIAECARHPRALIEVETAGVEFQASEIQQAPQFPFPDGILAFGTIVEARQHRPEDGGRPVEMFAVVAKTVNGPVVELFAHLRIGCTGALARTHRDTQMMFTPRRRLRDFARCAWLDTVPDRRV